MVCLPLRRTIKPIPLGNRGLWQSTATVLVGLISRRLEALSNRLLLHGNCSCSGYPHLQWRPGRSGGRYARSAADTGLPLVAVTLLHRKGYFRQHLRADGVQTEEDEPWNPETMLQPLEPVAAITIQGRPVMVRAWRKDIVGVDGHVVPVIFLDTDLDPNDGGTVN